MKYMLDTNICIYIIKERPESVIKRFRSELKSEICISSITLAEMEYGAEKSQAFEKNQTAINHFIKPLTILPFDDSDAKEYGKIRAYLEKRGTPIGNMDMLIAAHARKEGLILVTNNTREFERVPDLKLENWVE